jgi:hypothetical protein
MADNTCSNRHMNNGDTAYLDVGTIITEVKGFPSTENGQVIHTF